MLKFSTGLRASLLNALKTAFNDGVIRIYSGSPPASPDDAETGTLLATLTVGGGAFTPGSPTNGLSFDAVTAGDDASTLAKTVAETWQGDGLAAGTAGYFRFYDNAVDDGADTTAVRFQGTVGTASADLVLASTSVQVGVPVVVTGFTLTQPESD